jgi:hypothetical protein
MFGAAEKEQEDYGLGRAGKRWADESPPASKLPAEKEPVSF